MRKHLFYMAALAAFLLFTFETQAQSPLISGQILPKPGRKKVIHPAVAVGVNQGAAGENQVWDFSALLPENGADSVTFTYTKPLGTPFAADFPDANVAVRDNNGSYEYYNTANGEFELLGVRFPDKGDTFKITYTNPVVWFNTPITYNDMRNHTFRYIKEDFGNIVTTNGIVTTKADAYGTVKMPGGRIFGNVLRIHISTMQTDSVKSDFGDEINTQESNVYLFVQAGDSQELVSIGTNKETLQSGGVRNTKAVHYTKRTLITGVEQLNYSKTTFSISPNPAASRIININCTEKGTGLNTINVYNQLGQNVKRFVNIENNNITLNLEGLQSGIYFVQMQNSSGTTVKKLILE